jgi:hypothetical protein
MHEIAQRIAPGSRVVYVDNGTLDLSKPAALMLFGIMHFLPDSDDPHGVVARLLTALPSGSYLGIQHPTADFYPPGTDTQGAYRSAGIPFQWHPEIEAEPQPDPSTAGAYAALARKP